MKQKAHGTLCLDHPLVGAFTLSYEIFPLREDAPRL